MKRYITFVLIMVIVTRRRDLKWILRIITKEDPEAFYYHGVCTGCEQDTTP